MKLKLVLATVVAALSVFAANNASAAYACSLSVNPSNVILPGRYFSYGIDITWMPEVGPFIPSGPPFTVEFHGSKDGIEDIPPSGEPYPGVFGYGHSNLTGYRNPGDVEGYYERYAIIYGTSPVPGFRPYCITNSVYVYLFNWGWNM